MGSIALLCTGCSANEVQAEGCRPACGYTNKLKLLLLCAREVKSTPKGFGKMGHGEVEEMV